MNKILVSSLLALAAFGANVAAAQTYNSYNYGTTYTGGCINLTSDLSLGARGTQVTQLQGFLVGQNYPGAGAWMVTGYFGQATLQAVRNFEQSQGVAVSGVVDASTRAAISRVSCGLPGQSGPSYNWNSYTPYTSTNSPYSYNYNYNTYPYNYNGNCSSFYPYSCNTYSTVTLTSSSPVSGAPGTQVTLYGSGFDYSSNTVYVGGTTLRGIPSYNGTSLVFTIPANAGGAVSISVGNSRGTSNALTFSVLGGSTPCNAYPYANCAGYPYNYNYLPNSYPCLPGQGYYNNCPQNGQPTVNYLGPNSGAVGTNVTVYGSGFSTTDNAVHFGNGIIANLRSSDGISLSFLVPSSLSGYGYQPIGLGTYDVYVSNVWGARSGTVPFTITSLGTSAAPTITSVNGPTSLSVGTSGTWTIQVNNPNADYLTASVRWGDEGNYGYALSAPQTTYVQGTQTLTFTHTYYTSGSYTLTFTVGGSSGTSNVSSATVFVSSSPTTGNITLSYLSPTAGRVGTQVVLQGSGFSTLDNTVHFGIGGTVHVPSQNGTTIYYTIPYFVSPCDLIGQGCAAPAQQVVPGPYPIYVWNSQGTTNTLTFQVQ